MYLIVFSFVGLQLGMSVELGTVPVKTSGGPRNRHAIVEDVICEHTSR
jgi:hypothetical protein